MAVGGVSSGNSAASSQSSKKGAQSNKGAAQNTSQAGNSNNVGQTKNAGTTPADSATNNKSGGVCTVDSFKADPESAKGPEGFSASDDHLSAIADAFGLDLGSQSEQSISDRIDGAFQASEGVQAPEGLKEALEAKAEKMREGVETGKGPEETGKPEEAGEPEEEKSWGEELLDLGKEGVHMLHHGVEAVEPFVKKAGQMAARYEKPIMKVARPLIGAAPKLLHTGGEYLGVVGDGLTAAVAGSKAYQDFMDPNLSTAQRFEKVGGDIGEGAGTIAGSIAGGFTGGALALPVAAVAGVPTGGIGFGVIEAGGTIAGSVEGGKLGGWAGQGVGEDIGKALNWAFGG